MLIPRPIQRWKTRQSEKHETALRQETTTILTKHDLQYDLHEVKRACWTPWHQHTFEVVEVLTPPEYNSMFIRPMSDWRGKRVYVDMMHGEAADNINPFSLVRIPALRDDFAKIIEDFAIKAQTHWIAYESGMLHDD